MRLINRVLTLLLVLSLLVAMVACGSGSSNDNNTDTGNGTPTDKQLTDANRLELVRMVLSPESGQSPLNTDLSIQIRGGTAPYTYKIDFEGDGAFDKIIENVNDTTVTLQYTFSLYTNNEQSAINVTTWVIDSKNRVIVYDLENDPSRSKPIDNGIVVRVAKVTKNSAITFDPQYTGTYGTGFTSPVEGSGKAVKVNFESGSKVVFRALVSGGKAPYSYRWSVNGDTNVIQYVDKPGLDVNQKPIPSIFSWEYFVADSSAITGTPISWKVTVVDLDQQVKSYEGTIEIFPKGFTPSDDPNRKLKNPPLSNVIRFRKTADVLFPDVKSPTEKPDADGNGYPDGFTTTRKELLIVTSNPPYILADANPNIPREKGLSKIKYIELITDGNDPEKAALQISCAVADGVENIEPINYYFPLDTTGKPAVGGYDPEDKSIRCIVERNPDGSLKPADPSVYPLWKRVRASGTSPYLFQWDFTDDGVTDSQALAPTLPYLIGGSPYNPFLKPGTYYIRVKISDSYGRSMNDRTLDPKTMELTSDPNGNLSTELIKVVVKDGSTQPGVNMIEVKGDYQPFTEVKDTTKAISMDYKIQIKGGIPPYYVAWDVDGDLMYDDGIRTELDPTSTKYEEADLVIEADNGTSSPVLTVSAKNMLPGIRIPRVIVGDSRFSKGTFIEIAKNKFNKPSDPLDPLDERGKVLFTESISQKVFAEMSFPTVIASVKASTLVGKGTAPVYNFKARRGMGVAPYVIDTGAGNMQTAAIMAGGVVGNLSQRDVDAFNFYGKDGRYNSWSLTPMPTDRGYLTLSPFYNQFLSNKLVSLDARPPVMYAIGGYNNSFGALKTIESYTITDANPTSPTFLGGVWKTRIPMANPVFAHTAVPTLLPSGPFGVMIFGGLTGGTITDPMPKVTSQVLAFLPDPYPVPPNVDSPLDRFITTPVPSPMKTPRYNMSACSQEIFDIVGGVINFSKDSMIGVYTFGGQDSSSSTVSTSEYYNTMENSWSTIPDLPSPRAGTVAIAFQTHYPPFKANFDPNLPGNETIQRRITGAIVMGGFVKSFDQKLVPSNAVDVIVLSDALYIQTNPTSYIEQTLISPSLLNKIAPFTVDKYIPYKWISWTDKSKDTLKTPRYSAAGINAMYGLYNDPFNNGTLQEVMLFGGMGDTGELNSIERRRLAP